MESVSHETVRRTLKKPSAPSHLNLWVKAFEFHAGVLDAKLPVDSPLFRIGSAGPSLYLAIQHWHFTDAAVAQTLLLQATQFAFSDIQPTPMLGRVAEI